MQSFAQYFCDAKMRGNPNNKRGFRCGFKAKPMIKGHDAELRQTPIDSLPQCCGECEKRHGICATTHKNKRWRTDCDAGALESMG